MERCARDGEGELSWAIHCYRRNFVAAEKIFYVTETLTSDASDPVLFFFRFISGFS